MSPLRHAEAEAGAELLDRTFRNFVMVGAAVAAVLGLVWLVQGQLGLAALLFTMGGLELLVYRLRHGIGRSVALQIALAVPTVWIVAIVVLTGGGAGPRGVWLLLPPIIAALLLHARLALRWSLVYVLLALGIWGAALAGHTFPNMVHDSAPERARAISGAVALLATAALTLVYAFTQQRALNLVRTTNVHLASVLEALPEAVLAVERVDAATSNGVAAAAEHKVLFMNAAMAELLGGRPAGHTIEAFEPAGGRPGGRPGEFARQLLQQLEAVAASGRTLERRLELPGDERPVILDMHSRPIAAAHGRQIVTIVEDVTERLSVDQRLMQAARLASIGELVAGVAHELNNPLTAIRGTAELLGPETSGEFADDMRRIRDNADRAARIVRSLLSFAKETPPERQRTQLNDVVQHALRLRNTRDSGIRIVLDLDPDLPTTQADSNQLEQVLLNLASNAEHALQDTAAGEREIEIRTSRRGDVLVLEVRDNGPGIPPELLPRIFDPFFTTRRLGDGTGLGLAVSHGIVAKHGGAIHVRSEPGRGTAFTAELPILAPPPAIDLPAPAAGTDAVARAGATAAASADAAATKAAAAGERRVRHRRVLVIDDEPSIRSVLGRYLRRRGHEVQEAGSGDEADRLLGGDAGFDAIVLDIKMPGIHGDALFRRWRRERPNDADRVIFATGDTVSGATSGFLHSTGQPVFEKPYDLADLARAIEGGRARAGRTQGRDVQ